MKYFLKYQTMKQNKNIMIIKVHQPQTTPPQTYENGGYGYTAMKLCIKITFFLYFTQLSHRFGF